MRTIKRITLTTNFDFPGDIVTVTRNGKILGEVVDVYATEELVERECARLGVSLKDEARRRGYDVVRRIPMTRQDYINGVGQDMTDMISCLLGEN